MSELRLIISKRETRLPGFLQKNPNGKVLFYFHFQTADRSANGVLRSQSSHALEVMEHHLAEHLFFVSDRYTIADISLFAYVHIADEGELDLRGFPAIQSWVERVKVQPKYLPMTLG